MMKNKLIGIFVCVILIVTILPISGKTLEESTLSSIKSGNTLYVGGSGPGNYTKIQDAINDASDGDTVFVYDDLSPYYERIQINTSISLIGEDKNTTVIDAYGKGFAIFIKSDEVSIHEFTIQNSSGINYGGIRIDFDFGFCIISNNIIIDNDIGVSMDFAGSYNIIKDNIFFDNYDRAIRGSNTNNTLILGNTIDNSPGTYLGDGINFFYFTGNNITGNTINNCDSGISLGYDSDYNIILNNIINSNQYDGIRINDGSNNTVIGNNISYNQYWGIEIQKGNGNIIYHNNLEYNSWNAIDEGFNTWDDGKYGNYWSDYKQNYPFAKKLRKEGIWDTPYEIPSELRGNNYDNYPLINQYPKSVIKTKSIDKPWNYNFPILTWLLDSFPLLQRLLEWLI